MGENIIYIHIHEDEVTFMAWEGNSGKGFSTLEEARKFFTNPKDRLNVKIETIIHEHEHMYD